MAVIIFITELISNTNISCETLWKKNVSAISVWDISFECYRNGMKIVVMFEKIDNGYGVMFYKRWMRFNIRKEQVLIYI